MKQSIQKHTIGQSLLVTIDIPFVHGLFFSMPAWYHRSMIRRLLFDLDSTLYPASSGMEREITARMNDFTAHFLRVSHAEAIELRHVRMPKYGTTLEWLMAEHGLEDVEGFYLAVHPAGEEAHLASNPELAPYLASIDLPKSIFTNAPAEHAERVLRKLGLSALFDRIFDIRFCGYRGKPYPEAFRRVCDALNTEPSECVFIDDVPRYVRGFLAVGGHGVLIDEEGRHPDADMRSITSLFELGPMLREGAFNWQQLSLFAPAGADDNAEGH